MQELDARLKLCGVLCDLFVVAVGDIGARVEEVVTGGDLEGLWTAKAAEQVL